MTGRRIRRRWEQRRPLGRALSARRGSAARARRAALRSGRPQLLGLVSGVLLAFAVFAPWYRADLGGVFTPDSSSGWDATLLARIVLVLAVAIALASAALAADQRGQLDLRLDTADRLAWLVLVAAVLAVLLVAFRLVLPPEPREFFTRDWGLFLALAAGAGAAISGTTMRFVYA